MEKGMKVALICRSDATGGAAVVSFRLMTSLCAKGLDARLIVVEKRTDSPSVIQAAGKRRALIPFIAERLRIFKANGYDRSTLFRIDNASDGLPIHKIPFVREADVICLNWINQGMLSLKVIRKLAELGKPIVWTMHDMWNMTGICHHAGDCRRFLAPDGECGCCPLLGSKAVPDDLSHKTFLRKRDLYADCRIAFVAVSNWLARTARRSSLMKDADIHVIPNAFPEEYLIPSPGSSAKNANSKIRIVYGAARLDDPVKGLPVLVRATRIIADSDKDIARKLELVLFGSVKDPSPLEKIALPVKNLGMVSPEKIRSIYEGGDIVVSSSVWETLPGTLIEGQAWGCIPVAFDHGGQSDIIDHKKNGYLIPWSDDEETRARALADGIIWAAEHAGTLDVQMHKNVCDRFSEETVANQYISLFKSLSVRNKK